MSQSELLIVLIAMIGGAIRVSTPFMFVALGETLTEKSGRINLGLEGNLVLGAMVAYAGSFTTGSPWLGVLMAGCSGLVLGAMHGYICKLPKVNDIAVGIAFMSFGTGLAFFFGKAYIQPVAPRLPSIALGGWSDDPAVQKALEVNPLFLIGIVLATLIGVVVGISRLSGNWLVARLASVYVEVTRNIPLLLQLFFWYTIVTQLLPAVREALEPLPGVVLSKSGLQFPIIVGDPAHLPVLGVLALSVVAAFVYRHRAYRRQLETGQEPRLLLPMLAIICLPALAVFLVTGAPLDLDVPEFTRFNYRGGASVTPEFLALLLGLSIYTAGFIAEIVRSGILAVPWGQTEAAAALGFRRSLQLRLIVLPQALRIIVPPTTSNYLNLTKNSSLAVAIGYPDLVSVGNTTLNQTGQAIECISIMMAIYLTISLLISAFMNWYNRRIALVER